MPPRDASESGRSDAIADREAPLRPSMLRGRSHRTAIVLALAIAVAAFAPATPAFAFGQLPLISEDPSSPCQSTLDSAIAYSMDFVGSSRDSFGQQQSRGHLDMAAPLVQINYGITDRLQ